MNFKVAIFEVKIGDTFKVKAVGMSDVGQGS